MSASSARTERLALCDLLTDLGPDAPTLCAGWTTYDLAAHLVTRERRPQALPGLVLAGRARARTEALTEQTRRRYGYHALVAQLRQPPAALRLPVVEDIANLHELYVHHEDVRRANGARAPRALAVRIRRQLRRRLRVAAPLLLRGVRGVTVVLADPGHTPFTARRGTSTVRLTGDVGELLLYVYGRRDVAAVEVTGPPAAVARLAATRLGA